MRVHCFEWAIITRQKCWIPNTETLYSRPLMWLDLQCIHCGSNPSSVAWSCLCSKSIQHTSPSHLLMLITGLLMGSLQLSVVFSVGDSLGGSSSYCTILSHTGGRALSYFRSFRSGIGNWWQVSNTQSLHFHITHRATSHSHWSSAICKYGGEGLEDLLTCSDVWYYMQRVAMRWVMSNEGQWGPFL